MVELAWVAAGAACAAGAAAWVAAINGSRTLARARRDSRDRSRPMLGQSVLTPSGPSSSSCSDRQLQATEVRNVAHEQAGRLRPQPEGTAADGPGKAGRRQAGEPPQDRGASGQADEEALSTQLSVGERRPGWRSCTPIRVADPGGDLVVGAALDGKFHRPGPAPGGQWSVTRAPADYAVAWLRASGCGGSAHPFRISAVTAYSHRHLGSHCILSNNRFAHCIVAGNGVYLYLSRLG